MLTLLVNNSEMTRMFFSGGRDVLIYVPPYFTAFLISPILQYLVSFSYQLDIA